MQNGYEDDIIPQLEHHKAMCDAAGCLDSVLTKSDLEKFKPSIWVEVAKVVLPIIGAVIGPTIVFYGKFAVLEAQMQLVLKALKIN